MDEQQFQRDDFLPPAPDEQDLAVLVKKMQQQLALLEKKIDILINQSETKPRGGRNFSKSFRTFSHPHRRFERGHDENPPGEKRFFPGRHFEKRRGEEGHESGRHKKAYGDFPERDSQSPGHPFKKHYGGKKKDFVYREKPFYLRRKDRG
ncbi:MAG: hypothetical protein PHC33_01780 [Candidatus Omnitrophica bacterium]|nr:hypothetical protein [Candidatus Omnitrophota bacterium]